MKFGNCEWAIPKTRQPAGKIDSTSCSFNASTKHHLCKQFPTVRCERFPVALVADLRRLPAARNPPPPASETLNTKSLPNQTQSIEAEGSVREGKAPNWEHKTPNPPSNSMLRPKTILTRMHLCHSARQLRCVKSCGRIWQETSMWNICWRT